MAFNTDTNARHVIGLTYHSLPTFNEGIVVWPEAVCFECQWDRIRGRNLLTGEEFEVSTPGGRTTTRFLVSERWPTWGVGDHSDELRYFIYDIWAGGESTLLESPTGSGIAEISGNLAVWVEDIEREQSSSRLIISDLVTGEIVRTFDQHRGRLGPVDIEGSTLVYVGAGLDWFAGDPATIFIVDLDSGSTRTLTSGINTHEGGIPITTDERFIIFQAYPSGYDLQRDTWFHVPVGGHDVSLDDGMLAWMISRGEPSDLSELHLAPAEEFTSGQRSRYFPETGQWLALGFLGYWDANGGLPVFGFPIEPSHRRDQLLERQRLEWHPEHAGTIYEIELGRLGDELLLSQGREWQSFPQADPNTSHYFSETGHAIDERFWDYWSSHGLEFGDPGVSFRESLALFGYPLSEPMVETNEDGDTVLTQYFERAVFEWHPDNPEPYTVLLRRLGAELMATSE